VALIVFAGPFGGVFLVLGVMAIGSVIGATLDAMRARANAEA
jgi:hypothetical protein